MVLPGGEFPAGGSGSNCPLESSQIDAVTETEASRPASFTETAGNLVGDVNRLQHRSDDTFRAFLRGQAELHDVALASHEASIAMRLTAEIRNKLIDAYREIMRTPM